MELCGKVKNHTGFKNKTIYVYYLSDSRSVHAVSAMVKLGYKKVYAMKSGLLAWRMKGYATQ